MTDTPQDGAAIQAVDHLAIVDVDTGEILVNQRGAAASGAGTARVSSEQESDEHSTGTG